MPPALQSFELQLLLEMVRLRDETYSVPLVLALEQRLGRPVAPAAVFIALRRLEAKGLVRSRMDDGPGRRPRRYVKLTKQGLESLRAQRAEHARLWRGLDRLLRSHKA